MAVHRLFYIVFFLLIFPTLALASGMGVSPPAEHFFYQGEDLIKGTLTILPREEKNVRLFSDQGPLKDYIFFEGNVTELKLHIKDPTTVNYYIRPPKNLLPGNLKTTIVIEQYLTPEEKIHLNGMTAFAAVGFIIFLRVPNEGKYLESKLRIDQSSIKAGDPLYMAVDMSNIGTEDLTNLAADLTISNPKKEIIARKKTTTLDILKPGQLNTVMSFFDTQGQSSGIYTVDMSIDYGGQYTATDQAGFRIGEIYIKILNVSTELNESIGKIFVDVQSNWNDAIDNVYAEIKIKNDSNVLDTVKTSSVSLQPWDTARLTGFWERKSAAPGNYKMEIVVYYYDKEAQQEVMVTLPNLEKGSPQFLQNANNPLLLVVFSLLAVLLLVNIVWFFVNFKNKKKKKK